MTPSPGHLIYYCPYTCRCIGRCGTAARAARPGTTTNTSTAGQARSTARALCVMMTKDSAPYCDSSKAQARLTSPGLLPPRMGFLPRMAAVARALLDHLPRMKSAAPQVPAVCTDIEFTRKISALEAQIEQLEERNANLEESLRSLNSKFSSVLTSFKHFASSLPSF